MIFNNSAYLIRLMLSVPKEMRNNGLFHDELIKEMSDQYYIKPNFISKSLIYRFLHKIVR